MGDLQQKVEQAIHSRGLIPDGERVLVAVSGGLDSMVLLDLLARLAPERKWRLTVAHFNHRLRGRSSDADERLVREQAAKLELPFVSAAADVRKFAASRKVSIEMAARELRHGFLARVAKKREIRLIALAHHADDQVELFFLRILRGAGGEGLAGMKWKSTSPKHAKTHLVRPLLECTKAELSDWARRNDTAFREDATNASHDFQRNRIRHELLPLLRNHYQLLDKIVLRQMEIIGAETAFVAQLARKWLAAKRRTPFDELPVALQRRCIQIQLIELGTRTDFVLIEKLRKSVNTTAVINLRCAAVRDKAGRISLQTVVQPEFNLAETKIKLTGRAGELVVEGFRLKWRLLKAPNGTFRAPKRRVNCEYFDADKIGRTVVLRHWRPGDRFRPIGMEKSVKLQDIFTNQKVLRSQRRELMVCASETGELFWVEGLRIGERFKLDKSTVRQLKWQWERL